MQKLETFVANMTFWNWLALFAFLFATISVLNAVLSLKGRYLDWRAMRNKKQFANRLKLVEEQLKLIDKYRKYETLFYRHVLIEATFVAILALGSFVWLIPALLVLMVPPGNLLLQALFSLTAFMMVSFALDKTGRLYRLSRAVNAPTAFVERIRLFLETGRQKNLIPTEEMLVDKLLTDLLLSERQ